MATTHARYREACTKSRIYYRVQNSTELWSMLGVDAKSPLRTFRGRWIKDGARDPAHLGSPHKTNKIILDLD
jgi:hypothetical protein